MFTLIHIPCHQPILVYFRKNCNNLLTDILYFSYLATIWSCKFDHVSLLLEIFYDFSLLLRTRLRLWASHLSLSDHHFILFIAAVNYSSFFPPSVFSWLDFVIILHLKYVSILGLFHMLSSVQSSPSPFLSKLFTAAEISLQVGPPYNNRIGHISQL